MRTTAEIVRLSVARAMAAPYLDRRRSHRWSPAAFRLAKLAATYACELAQADAAALLEPVRMRKEDGGVSRDD
jgi:hypothetical protein